MSGSPLNLSLAGDGGIFAAGLIDVLENMFDAAFGLVVMFVILLAVVFAVMTWTRTRSLVPTLGALVLGALVVVIVANFSWLSQRIGDDVEKFDSEADDSEFVDPPDRISGDGDG